MTTATRVIRWGRHYELGVGIVDRQHHQICDLLNRLHDQWLSNAPRRALAVTLGLLIDSASIHFQTEEDLMREHRLAQLSSHKAEHDLFANKIYEFQRDFEAGRTGLDERVFGYIADWLRNHMLVTDRPMCHAIIAKSGPTN